MFYKAPAIVALLLLTVLVLAICFTAGK